MSSHHTLIVPLLITPKITAKERLSTQQHTKGSRQWYQEEEAYQVRFYQRNGP
jgi:hypothetical protein